MREPAPAIAHVLLCIALLLGAEDPSWADCRALIQQSHANFCDQLSSLNVCVSPCLAFGHCRRRRATARARHSSSAARRRRSAVPTSPRSHDAHRSFFLQPRAVAVAREAMLESSLTPRRVQNQSAIASDLYDWAVAVVHLYDFVTTGKPPPAAYQGRFLRGEETDGRPAVAKQTLCFSKDAVFLGASSQRQKPGAGAPRPPRSGVPAPISKDQVLTRPRAIAPTASIAFDVSGPAPSGPPGSRP